MFLPLFILVSFPLGILASLVLLARCGRSRRGRDLAGAPVARVLTLPAGWALWVVFSRIVVPRGG